MAEATLGACARILSIIGPLSSTHTGYWLRVGILMSLLMLLATAALFPESRPTVEGTLQSQVRVISG
jgi:hypothetical protein